ncbi:MAG: MFS transporter [Candidatus Lokiarchaeota archaeon]|nr:MFS transporter [Candidatus Lokiarchaeota archaeon]
MKKESSTELVQRSVGYIVFLFAYMMLYEFMDTYTTSYYTSVVSYIQADFNIGNPEFYMVQAIASIGLLLVIFVQNLADRIGRKPMMIIVFFGMGFASLIMHISRNIYLFTFGFLLSWIFFSSDMWVIIVAEEAPAEKRARYSYLIATVGALGAIAIPICRQIFIKTEPSINPSQWRGMNYLALAAMVLALLGFGMKETKAFLLKKQTKQEISLLKKFKRANLGVPFKQPETRRRIIAFMIIGFLLGMMAAVIATFEEYLTGIIVITHGGSPDQVTYVIYLATLGTFVFFGITGFLADKLGRKPTMYIYAGINLVFYAIIAFAANRFASLGIFWIFSLFGFFMNGSFWGMFMLSKTYCVENFPTHTRGTATGWRSFSYAVGLILGSLLSSFLVKFLDLQYLYLISSALSVMGVCILTATVLPETKGIKIIETELVG